MYVDCVFFLISRIQDLDGGFFEKFGSLLRQKSELDEVRASTPLAPLAPLPSVSEDGSGEAAGDGEDVALRLSSIEEGDHDSGTETLQDSDSDPDEQDQTNSLQEDLLGNLVGWNVSITNDIRYKAVA